MDLDAQLLDRYARTRDADAFTQLVRRHAGMVFGVARRVTGDHHDAEEVAQGCFLQLARQAASIHGSLPAWLHTTATRRAADTNRAAARRRRHERVTARPEEADEAAWVEIAPLVDAALAELPEELRLPVVLYHLEGRTQAELAAELSVNQSTVSRRIEAGVAALREKLAAVGVTASGVALPALLTQYAVEAAPKTLVAALGKVAVAGVVPGVIPGAGASSASKAAGWAVRAAWRTMAMSFKTKTAAAAVFAVVAVLGSGTVIYRTFSRPGAPPRPATAALVARPPAPGWRERFEGVYRLEEGKVLKRIAPPFIPERMDYYRQDTVGPAKASTQVPGSMLFDWDGRPHWAAFGFGRGDTLRTVLQACLGLPPAKITGSESILGRPLPGDWVRRHGASQDEVAQALSQNLNKELGWKIRIVREAVQRDVIVARGAFVSRPLDPQRHMPTVYSYLDKLTYGREGAVSSSGSGSQFLEGLGVEVTETFIDETSNLGGVRVEWHSEDCDMLNTVSGPAKRKGLNRLLEHVTAQTGLTFTHEQRPLDIWRVTEDP